MTGGACALRVGARLYLADVDNTGRPLGVIGASMTMGSRVALVNDVVTTGEGIRKLAELARAAGAEVVGGAWFASRALVDVASILSAPTVHVTDVPMPATGAGECLQCRDQVRLQLAIDLS
jgi:orotate phosphoribosyltransferase